MEHEAAAPMHPEALAPQSDNGNQPQRCIAITERGVRCRTYATTNSERCAYHGATIEQKRAWGRRGGLASARRGMAPPPATEPSAQPTRLDTPEDCRRALQSLHATLEAGEIGVGVARERRATISEILRAFDLEKLLDRLRALERRQRRKRL